MRMKGDGRTNVSTNCYIKDTGDNFDGEDDDAGTKEGLIDLDKIRKEENDEDEGEDHEDIEEHQELDAVEVVVFYILLAMMWLIMLAPPIYDIVLFIYYAVYDFGSSIDVYVEDHLSGWTVWVIAQCIFSVLTIVFYGYIIASLAMELSSDDAYSVENSVISDTTFWWIFMVANSWSMLTAAAKFVLILTELYMADEAKMTDFFHMDTEAGQLNFEIELWPDIVKTCILGLNYAFYVLMPLICEMLDG